MISSDFDAKWQKEWETARIFEAKDDSDKPKFYCLEMFPYPSGSGLHMGHAFNYTLGDIYARFKRMNGYNVLYPMGYDSFGLPAENAAIKEGIHPKKYTEDAISYFSKQQKTLGLSYDWTRAVYTHRPDYYKWDQWIFLKMYEKGLAYRRKAPVSYCPKCETVLANEQIHGGKCWRHNDTDVEIRQLEQWFFKVTDYADELYEGVEKLTGWPESIKAMQRNWIGKSHGVELNFEINGKDWPVFTTRPDTIYGVTFTVISAQHPNLMDIVTPEHRRAVESFLKSLKSMKEEDIQLMEKDGVFTGSYAINPLTGDKLPVYAGNFVVADYGSGMVMAVPAHDQRDFEFAKKYGLPIRHVIAPVYGETHKDAEFRKTISAVIRRKDGKFLIVKWKEFGWVAPAIGGVENDEDPLKTAEREVYEETGYKTSAVRALGGPIESNFFADNKKVWRKRLDQPVLLELIGDEPDEVDGEEKNKHEAAWLSAEEALKQITHEYNKIGIQRLIGGERAYVDDGVLVNSDRFTGMDNRKAIEEIADHAVSKGLGKKAVLFKLRDWLVSRQRYWGTPIPMIKCKKCGYVPVPESQLPVELPMEVKFGEGNPLATNKDFVKTKCPRCEGDAERETDTMDTFVNSSWYYLRYCDANNDKKIFDSEKAQYWTPIDTYIGGAEHACMHLIYFRFCTKFLRDIGLLKIDEPTYNLFNQGMVHGPDGAVMSKSRGNVVDPLDTIKKYNVDTLRFYLVSTAGPDKDFIWSDDTLESSFKFTNKIIAYYGSVKEGKSSRKIDSKYHSLVKGATEDIGAIKYNLTLIKLRQFFEALGEEESREVLEGFLKLLHPFCPHMTEELWQRMGNKPFISLAQWPVADESRIDKKLEEQERAAENLAKDINNVSRLIKEKGGKITKVFVYVLPQEKDGYSDNIEAIRKSIGMDITIFAVNDKQKHDPQGKASRTKPGKPAIYLE